MTTPDTPSDFLERAMSLAEESANAAWDAAQVGPYERLWMPLAEKRDSTQAKLRTHLEQREEAFEKLQRQAAKLADELRRCIALIEVIEGDVVASAHTALAEWGGSGARKAMAELVEPNEMFGPLNPMWVEWLMGWPIGWTDLEPLETGRSPSVPQQHSGCSAQLLTEEAT